MIAKKYTWKCLKCGEIFDDDIDNGNLPRCPKCYPKAGTSLVEKDVLSFCQSYFTNIKSEDRDLIPPYEIDIFIPEIGLGIELNGVYCHSDLAGNKNKEYHQNKLLLALEKNIQLVQIFEDEWIDKQSIVESILLNKFNRNQNRIFARKCQIYSVPTEDAKQFYFDNHLQGFINGQYLGLYYNGEFVSMITIGLPRFDPSYDIEIYRFCSKLNTSVIGSLSKLTNAIFKISDNYKSIITYADARYGLGLGYAKCGFKFLRITSPGYYYIKCGTRKRLSRNQFQKHMLKAKLKLFDETLTEWENM